MLRLPLIIKRHSVRYSALKIGQPEDKDISVVLFSYALLNYFNQMLTTLTRNHEASFTSTCCVKASLISISFVFTFLVLSHINSNQKKNYIHISCTISLFENIFLEQQETRRGTRATSSSSNDITKGESMNDKKLVIGARKNTYTL